MKNIILIILSILLMSCQDGPRAVFNEEFVQLDPKKEFPFENLVGEYNLDKYSKLRYKIKYDDSMKITIKKDSTFIAENYLDYKTDSLLLKKFKGKLLYRNNFKESIMYLQLRDGKFNGGGGIDIYHRRKDSVIALYVYTPFIPATKENNMKYREGDYLRYIKIK